MDLLVNRTTNISYPTDAALEQQFRGEGDGSRLLTALFQLTGGLGGGTFGYQVSTDNGTTWTTGDYTATAAGFLGPISLLPGWRIRPTLTGATSASLTVRLFP